LYAALGPKLVRYAASVIGDEDLAQDVVQGVFCKVLTLPSRQVRAVRDVAAWMTRLVRNEAISMVRSTSRAQRRDSAHVSPASSGGREEDDRAAGLRQAIGSLDTSQWEVVILRCGMGLTFDQIADVLGEPRSTVASRNRAAIDRLREMLGEETAIHKHRAQNALGCGA